MLRKLRIVGALLLLVVITSCKAKKELQAAVAENDQLKAKNSELTNTINGLQKQVSDLGTTNKSLTDQYNQYRTGCEASKAKLAAVQSALNEQLETLKKVQERIDKALENFKDKGVSVFYRDGLLYVEMQEGLLYKSGSAKLGDQGIAALGNLCSVLNDYPKLSVIVVGNTDTVKFKNGAIDNWSLSTERSNGVVRLMRDKFSVDPSRLTSSGRGKYDPVADNGTPEGRARNRRTDIILNPNFERIWESAKQGQ